jgi:hypothetical protein
VLLGSCVTCIVLVQPTEEEQKQATAERKPLIDNTTKRLAAIRTSFPELKTLREAKCPDDAIAASTSDAPHYFVDYDNLERFTNPAVNTEAEAWKQWEFLSSSAVREIKTTAQLEKANIDLTSFEVDEMTSRIKEIDKAKTLVVVRGKKVVPEVKDDNSFSGGEFVGFAVVFDWINTKPLCQAQLNVENSDTVEFRKRGIAGSTFKEAVMEDLEENYKKDLKAALARISSKIQPAL